MLADRLPDDERLPLPLERPLPVLVPVLVAPAAEVEEVLRGGRAVAAMLALQLRAAEHDAPADEAPAEDPAPEVDLGAARQLLDAALHERVTRRRRELTEQLERERASAAAVVSVAQAEAAALVATASDERLQVLLEGVEPQPRTSPSLRVVSDADASRDLAGELEVGAPEVMLLEPVAPVASALDAAHPAAPLLEQPLGIAQPVIADPQLPDPGAMTAAQAAAIAAASQLLLRQAAPAPVPHEAQTVREKGFWGRWLYLDVLLPMVAVIIVLVVLLAWVG